MQSSLIGKIEKAKRYADERNERVRFDGLRVSIQGENDAHHVELSNGRLSCTCDFYGSWQICSHTMTMERVLNGMLPAEARDQVLDKMGQPA